MGEIAEFSEMPIPHPEFRYELALLSLLFAAFACSSPNDPLPEEMIGRWRNPAPGYDDNYFEIRTRSIVIGVNKYESKFHPIVSVEATTSGGAVEFRIEYATDEGGVAPLLVALEPGSPPRIRIGARPDRWVREDQAHLLDGDAS
jgi:hypothetical protein